MAGENDGVARPHLDELVVAASQQRKRRHRLALRPRGNDANLFWCVVIDVFNVDD